MAMQLVRVWVTEGCNALCHHCMNKTYRSTAQMDVSHFVKICDYFSQHGLKKISLMGGEPTTHPSFQDFFSIAAQYFDNVFLFTNGLRNQQLKLCSPRDGDIIIYNSLFSDHFTEETLLLEKNGKRILDVVIDHTTNETKTINNVKKVLTISGGRVTAQLVLNNSINIFEHRVSIAEKIRKIYNHLFEQFGNNIEFQCGAPICFTYGLDLPSHINRTICPNESILIDGNYYVRFCNLYPEKLINLFVGEKIIPFEIIENHIRLASYKHQLTALDKICKYCLFYKTKCNGKCHIPQQIITEDSIRNNTDIPWLKFR